MVGVRLLGARPDRETVRPAAASRAGLAAPEELAADVSGAGSRGLGHIAVLALVAARFHRHRADKAPQPTAAISLDHGRERVFPFRRAGVRAGSKMVLGRGTGADRVDQPPRPSPRFGHGLGTRNRADDFLDVSHPGISKLLLPRGVPVAAWGHSAIAAGPTD